MFLLAFLSELVHGIYLVLEACISLTDPKEGQRPETSIYHPITIY